MSEELVIRHCSPTLAGLKTANMFACQFESREDLRDELSSLNKVLINKGMRALPLKYANKRALIYIYRPNELKCDLQCSKACEVLKNCGYNCQSAERCIAQLMSRLNESDEFPHEIGLFLGYPPEDVEGFMQKRPCKLTGFWKVYGDAEKAEKLFESFRKCMKVYYSCWSSGFSLDRLAVAKYTIHSPFRRFNSRRIFLFKYNQTLAFTMKI